MVSERASFHPGDPTPLTKVAALKLLAKQNRGYTTIGPTDRATVERWFDQTVDQIISSCDAAMAASRWTCTTVRTKLGSLIGVNSRLSGRMFDPTSPVFKDYLRHIQTLCFSHETKFPYPLSQSNALAIAEELKLSGDDELLALFSLEWSTTARTSDALFVRPRRVTFSETTTVVTFVEGKGVRARGAPYTVSFTTPFAPSLRRAVRRALRDKETYLFPPERHGALRQRLKNILKKCDPRLELRSLRRGSLQHMAAQGVSLELLMTFSGHTNKQTMLRYLDWGVHAAAVLDAQVEASAHLW